jgi:hypothetical protein
VTGGRDRVPRDPALAGELREHQARGECRDHEHEDAAARRQHERGDVEIADHRFARSEHDALGEPANDWREDRESEQLHEEMKCERLAPTSAQIRPCP